MARKIVRSCVAHGQVEGAADMPRLSLFATGLKKTLASHRVQVTARVAEDGSGCNWVSDSWTPSGHRWPYFIGLDDLWHRSHAKGCQAGERSAAAASETRIEAVLEPLATPDPRACEDQVVEKAVDQPLCQSSPSDQTEPVTRSEQEARAPPCEESEAQGSTDVEKKREEVLASLVQGLRLQRQQVEARASSAERRLRDSESQLLALHRTTKQATVAMPTERTSQAAGMKEAKQCERQRVLKQRKKDDQHRRQEQQEQRILQEMKAEAQRECQQQIESVRAEIAVLHCRAKSHTKAQKIAAVRERSRIIQAAKAEAQDLLQRQAFATAEAQELVGQQEAARVEAQELVRQHAEAVEELARQQAEQMKTQESRIDDRQPVVFAPPEPARDADGGEAREEVLISLVHGLKGQRLQAERRAASAEEQLGQHLANKATCLEVLPLPEMRAPLKPCAAIKGAKDLERQRALKQQKLDDQRRRRAQQRQRLVDEAQADAQKEYASQMDVARAEIAKLKAQARGAAKAHAKAQRAAAIRDGAQILQAARLQAEALVKARAEVTERHRAEVLAQEPALVTSLAVAEAPDDSNAEELDDPAEGPATAEADPILAAAQWELLPDPEVTVDDSWDIIG